MESDRRRVLIFDDDPVFCRSVVQMSQHFGLSVKYALTPGEFFSEVEIWKPTYIILDLIMPDMDGVEVLVQLAAGDCKSRIILSSGVGTRVLKAAERSALEHGLQIVGVLSKPFTLDAFSAVFGCEDQPQTLPKSQKLADPSEDTITEGEIQDAIREGQFFVVFQPKVDCLTTTLRGFETLVRWDHPQKGIVMPDQFIRKAERLDLIGPMTDLIVDLTLNWFHRSIGNSGLTVSINISAKTLGDWPFVDKLLSLCRKSDVSPSSVILEITETAAMDDQLIALDMFTRLRMKGFHVSIDDFGTGNSSLALLARLPFSEIKVDKSFAINASKSEESKAIIRSTVDLSHSLDLTVVTEGVEDQETLEFLRDIRCDQAQGYYIARPMKGDRVLDWMVEKSVRPNTELL